MGVPDSESKGRKLYFAGIRVRPIVVGTLAFLSVAALVMQERGYRRRLEHTREVEKGNCEAQAFRQPLPGGIEMFPLQQTPHSNELPECNGIVFVQSDNRDLVLDFVENEFRDAHRDAPGQVPGDVRVLSAMINRGYAQTFGYCHVWAKCTATDRHPAWCKVKAVEWAAKRYTSSDVIYLESDAYVRTQRPVDLTQLRQHGAVAAFTLSCEWFPFVHNTLGYVEEVSIEKHRSIFHNGDYLGALKTANGTRAADPKNPVDTPEALATSVFVIMGGDEGGLKLLERWWAAAPEAKGERMSRASEPAALNAVLAADTEARLRVDVLDYPTYNGADGEFIRHMSGGRGLDPVFKHDIADTLLRHADKTTLYFTELFGDLFKVDVSV